MTTFAVPPEGLPLSHTQLDLKEPQQIIRIDLKESICRDLLRAVKSNESAKIRFGRKPGLTIGTKHVSLHHSTNKFPQEIFSGSLDGKEPAYFSGKLSLSLETQHAREAIASTDHALANLKNTLKATQEERAASEAGVLNNRLLKPLQRPSPLSGGLLGSRPSSPFLGAAMSPRPGAGPTSAPLMPSLSKQDKIKLDAIKIPTVHLLAIEAQDPQVLANTLRVKRTDLDKVLEKVARSADGKKELKDRAYRDLDVWTFPYRSQNDRQAAIDRAVSAYDRLRVEKSDNLWQMLLAKEDRGKGIFLSKLNFDKPLATGNLTPKLTERSTDGGSTEGKSMASDLSNKRGKAPISKVTDSHPITKPTSESKAKSTASKDPLKLIAAASKESKKSQSQSQSQSQPHQQPLLAKRDLKQKAAARVKDLDEDADAGHSLSTKTAVSSKRSLKDDGGAPSEKRPSVSRPLSSTKQPTVSLSQPASSLNGVDRGRLTPSTMAKTRSGADTSRPQNTSRPRNGSSPAKPSPLGSSPPTNSRDADTTSNSSKGTSQSSAPSSPPDSSELSQSKRRTYSPVVTDTKSEKQVNGSVKRKAETTSEQPPAKRQQVKKSEAEQKERFNSLPKSLAEEVDKKPPVKRDSSESDASSTSDKIVTKQHVIEEARRFHAYWDKYKDLHDRLSKERNADRDEKDLDNLWKMHTRLKVLKEQIWKDWAKIEKIESGR